MSKRLFSRLSFLLIVLVVLFVFPIVYSNFGGLYINVENASNRDFDRVDINFLGQEVSYGKLPAGEKSEYIRINKAFDYAYIKVKVGRKNYELRPIDYVGESLLPTGKYTYKLEFEKSLITEEEDIMQTITPENIGFLDSIGVRLTEIINDNFLGRY